MKGSMVLRLSMALAAAMLLLLLAPTPTHSLVQPLVRYTTTEGLAFLAQNIKKSGWKETKSGLQYRVVKRSSKKDALSPNITSPVLVSYVGKNIRGEIFDGSNVRGVPTEMKPSHLIPGWQEALLMMKEGDQWQITVPAELGYRDRKMGKITPGSVLIFDLELVKVVTEADVVNPFGFISSLPELCWNACTSFPAPLWVVVAYFVAAFVLREWHRATRPPPRRQGEARSLEELQHPPTGSVNPRVFLDVQIGSGGQGGGRIEFELFPALCPRTVENFRCLCTGEKGVAARSWYNWMLGRSTLLHYKGNRFHRIVPGFMAQGGDIEHNDGDGGRCIYGTSVFDDEFEEGFLSHSQAGLLSMANCGPNSNSSQFFVTFAPAEHCDQKHVVFGAVVRGMEVVQAIEAAAAAAVAAKGRRAPIVIVDCGQLAGQGEGQAKTETKKMQ